MKQRARRRHIGERAGWAKVGYSVRYKSNGYDPLTGEQGPRRTYRVIVSYSGWR